MALIGPNGQPIPPTRGTVRLPGGEVVEGEAGIIDGTRWGILIVAMDGVGVAGIVPIQRDAIEMVEVEGLGTVIAARGNPTNPDGSHHFVSAADAVGILCDSFRKSGVALPEGYPGNFENPAEEILGGDGD